MKRKFGLPKTSLFFLGWIGAFILGGILAVNNVTGLRGPPLGHNPFVHANQDYADLTVVCMLVLIAAWATFASIRLQRMRPLACGIWFGVISSLVMIILR
jgi:hypothetical protein